MSAWLIESALLYLALGVLLIYVEYRIWLGEDDE